MRVTEHSLDDGSAESRKNERWLYLHSRQMASFLLASIGPHCPKLSRVSVSGALSAGLWAPAFSTYTNSLVQADISRDL
jgi:hypothetical protein